MASPLGSMIYCSLNSETELLSFILSFISLDNINNMVNLLAMNVVRLQLRRLLFEFRQSPLD